MRMITMSSLEVAKDAGMVSPSAITFTLVQNRSGRSRA
jgi:hypothetical protein